MTGSRSWPVISATALTWPVFSAISAMTAGSTSRIAAMVKVGVCHPTTSLPSAATTVCDGKPNHEASADGRGVPAQVRGGLGGAAEHGGDLADGVVEQPGQRRAEDQGEEDRDAADEPAERDGRDDREGHRGQGDPLVLGPVDAGDDRGEVEADQHDDGTGDDRGQHLVQHRASRGSGSARRRAAAPGRRRGSRR